MLGLKLIHVSKRGHSSPTYLGLGLGLDGLYSATNCADNILGRFTMILQIKLQDETHSQI